MKHYVRISILQILGKSAALALLISGAFSVSIFISEILKEKKMLTEELRASERIIRGRVGEIEAEMKKILQQSIPSDSIQIMKYPSIKITMTQLHSLPRKIESINFQFQQHWSLNRDLIINGYCFYANNIYKHIVAYIPQDVILNETNVIPLRFEGQANEANIQELTLYEKKFTLTKKLNNNFFHFVQERVYFILNIYSLVLFTAMFTVFSFVFGQRRIIQKQVLHKRKHLNIQTKLQEKITALSSELQEKNLTQDAISNSLETRTNLLGNMVLEHQKLHVKMNNLIDLISEQKRRGEIKKDYNVKIVGLLEETLKTLRSIKIFNDTASLKGLVQYVLQLYMADIIQKGIRLSTKLPTTQGNKLGNESLYVLAAVIGRRVAALHKKGELFIEVSEDASRVEIRDNGFTLSSVELSNIGASNHFYNFFDSFLNDESQCTSFCVQDMTKDDDGMNVTVIEIHTPTPDFSNVINFNLRN